jgi:Rieske Fe-S protein
MHEDTGRLSRILDDLAADRDPGDRQQLTAEESNLAAMAAFLRSADARRLEPSADFVESLAQELVDRPVALHRRLEPSPATRPSDHTEAQATVNRKSALFRAVAAVAGLAVGGSGLAVAYEHGRSEGGVQEAERNLTAPMVPADRGSWHFTGYNRHQVGEGSAVRFRAGALEGFLINPGPDRELYALSAVCTHMGCILSWLGDAKTLLCPCHGAQYDASGTVISGVARHPLPRLQTKLESSGAVYVWSVDENPTVKTVAPYIES